jgi:ATP-dependent Clp protease adaptor protein ClpS
VFGYRPPGFSSTVPTAGARVKGAAREGTLSTRSALDSRRDVSAKTSTPTRKRPDSGSGSGRDEPWRVIVLNDNHNTFEGVAAALAATIPGVSYEQGLRLADRIHNTGRSIVWSGHRELAELYWSQLEGRGLTMAPLER